MRSKGMSVPDSKIDRVVVYGATGAQARPVVRKLREAGLQVRDVTRDPNQHKAQDLRSLGADVIRSNFSDRESLRAATTGADAVFLLVPFADPRPEYGTNAIDAAREAGVKLLVWNPTGTIPPVRTGNPGLDVRLDILEHLRGSGVPHIVLQPTGYMENFLMPWHAAEVADDGVFAYPMPPETRIQWISHEDMAAFAVAAFRRPELATLVLQVSGPEQLTGDEIAHRFSRALGRPIRFRAMPPREMAGNLEPVLGSEAAESVRVGYERLFENPTLLSTDVDLDAILTQLPIEPTPLEAWVRRHASAFTPAPAAVLA
jgi:uncharacterized protein YbjT (DUF2867 family)